MVVPSAVSGQDMEGSGLGEQPLSRQVFIVQELEVRDRLASSQINKFLYLYTSESMPRRAHSNMVSWSFFVIQGFSDILQLCIFF